MFQAYYTTALMENNTQSPNKQLTSGFEQVQCYCSVLR